MRERKTRILLKMLYSEWYYVIMCFFLYFVLLLLQNHIWRLRTSWVYITKIHLKIHPFIQGLALQLTLANIATKRWAFNLMYVKADRVTTAAAGQRGRFLSVVRFGFNIKKKWCSATLRGFLTILRDCNSHPVFVWVYSDAEGMLATEKNEKLSLC